MIEAADGVRQKHKKFHAALNRWWKKHVSEIEALPETGNVFDLRSTLLGSISDALTPQNILTSHQVRGAFAAYMKSLEADFKSIAASGWGPELIPDEDILQSQFPDVLEKSEQDRARIADLEALFAAAEENEDGEVENEEDSDSGVLPKTLVKSLKDQKKELSAQMREIRKLVKAMRQDAKRMESAGYGEQEINTKRAEASDSEAEGVELASQIEAIDQQLATHDGLAEELKEKKAAIKQVEKQKDELVAKAREKISDYEAKELILERLQRVLTERFDGYLREYQRELIADVENLWSKYAVTTKTILNDRDAEATQLDDFLKELGYE